MSTFYEKVVGFDVHLGPRRKLLAIAVLGVGLLIFFVPLVATDPQVLGKAHWSMFDVVSNVYAGDFFPSRVEIVSFPVAVPIACLLMLCSLVMCLFSLTRGFALCSNRWDAFSCTRLVFPLRPQVLHSGSLVSFSHHEFPFRGASTFSTYE